MCWDTFVCSKKGVQHFKGKFTLYYKFGVDIVEENSVLVTGPYPVGKYPDIKIFQQTLLHHLNLFERVVADDGYIGKAPERVKCLGT